MYILLRHRERLILFILGIFLVSLAAGLSAATARSVQGAFDEELARSWRTDYDILVRPLSAVAGVELEEESISGKFQSNISLRYGINWRQLEAIRSIEGVEVAAPLAVVGPAFININAGIPLPYDDLAPGVYKEEITVLENNGIEEIPTKYTRYFFVNENFTTEFGDGEHIEILPFYNAGLSIPPLQNSFYARQYTFNIVAVDFDAEAALHGLDKAIIAGSLPPRNNSYGDLQHPTIPVLLNSANGPAGKAQVSLTKLTDFEPTRETLDILARTKKNMLVRSREQHIKDFILDLDQALTFPNLGETVLLSNYLPPEGLNYTRIDGSIALVAGNVGGTFSLITANQDVIGSFETIGNNQWFRPVYDSHSFGRRNTTYFTYAGLFDPEKLMVMPRDSPVAAPMEIYRSSADRILKGFGGQSVPDNTYAKFVHPYDFVGAPIGGLVSFEVLDLLNLTIDSVRVRVSGVDDMSDASQLRIAYIAQQIRDITGLHVDIVLGSAQQRKQIHLYSYDNQSRRTYIENVTTALAGAIDEVEENTGLPVRVRFITYDDMINDPWIYDELTINQRSIPWVYIPRFFEEMNDYDTLLGDLLAPHFAKLGYTEFDFRPMNFHREITILMPEYQFAEDEPRDLYGVVEQYWIKLGAGLRIYEETNRGTFWITLALLAVGALFIGNTTYISAVGRIGEFSVLRSLGWRRSTVFRVSLFETLLISFLAGLVTAGVLALVWHFSDRYMEPWVLLLAAPVVILTFLVGSVPPLVRTIFIPPLQGSRQGELKSGTRIEGAGRFGFVLRGLALRPGRSLVTILAMIIPGGTLAFIFFIYFGIQSVLGETMLGEYLAVELQSHHFILNALVFAVAGLAVTDTLLINLRERQKEFGLLKAVGWRSSTVASLLFWEGVGLGLVGGIIGTVAAGYAYIQVFGLMPPNPWLNGAILMLIPAFVGGLAAIVPAIRAARIPAAEVIRQD